MAVCAAAFIQTVSAYSSYLELIPNGEAIGKPLGHSDTGYTDFGTLFSDKGTEWAKVCSETWPGGSVTCGEALGDPCCTWTTGKPDVELTEPNLEGAACSTGSTAAGSGSVPVAPATDAAIGDSPVQMEEPAQTDPTVVADSSEFCD